MEGRQIARFHLLYLAASRRCFWVSLYLHISKFPRDRFWDGPLPVHVAMMKKAKGALETGCRLLFNTAERRPFLHVSQTITSKMRRLDTTTMKKPNLLRFLVERTQSVHDLQACPASLTPLIPQSFISSPGIRLPNLSKATGLVACRTV